MWKFALWNEDRSDSYNDIDEDMDDFEIMGGYKISNEQIEGLEKCDDAGEGSEVSITKNINDGPSLDECKVPSTL